MSTRATARSKTSGRWWRRRTRGASGCSSSSSSTTRPTSTRGSRRARRAPRGSREREFYVWSDTDQRFPETRIIFTDTEKSNWTYDAVAGQYYWHRFFAHQPDLNHNNPEVVSAVIDVMMFWLDLGVDALRLDAVPYLCVREGTTNENLPETHAVLKRMRRELDARYPDRMLLAEANQWPADVRAVLRRRRRVPHGVPLPADAAHLHGRAAGGPAPDRRHPQADAGASRRRASGHSSSATMTS